MAYDDEKGSGRVFEGRIPTKELDPDREKFSGAGLSAGISFGDGSFVKGEIFRRVFGAIFALPLASPRDGTQ